MAGWADRTDKPSRAQQPTHPPHPTPTRHGARPAGRPLSRVSRNSQARQHSHSRAVPPPTRRSADPDCSTGISLANGKWPGSTADTASASACSCPGTTRSPTCCARPLQGCAGVSTRRGSPLGEYHSSMRARARPSKGRAPAASSRPAVRSTPAAARSATRVRSSSAKSLWLAQKSRPCVPCSRMRGRGESKERCSVAVLQCCIAVLHSGVGKLLCCSVAVLQCCNPVQQVVVLPPATC